MTALHEHVGNFFSLTPERVLDAVEHSGLVTTGLCYPLNSLENRVYEVELDDGRRLIGKFYRPGRWSRETIQNEHDLLRALLDAEIPVCPPVPFDSGGTIEQTDDGIFYTLFPKSGGRAPEDLSDEQLRQLGRLLGRIHNVAGSLPLEHRPALSPATYGTGCLRLIRDSAEMPAALEQRYADAVAQLVEIGERRFEGVATQPIHADCHRGNLLFGPEGWYFLDFDDMAHGPPVQDLWLLLPGRRGDSQDEIDQMIEGYELFREFDRSTLRLIEVLRGLRYVRYAAWIATRWQDPSFPRAFPEFGTEHYWQAQLNDLHEQLRVIQSEDQPATWY